MTALVAMLCIVGLIMLWDRRELRKLTEEFERQRKRREGRR